MYCICCEKNIVEINDNHYDEDISENDKIWKNNDISLSDGTTVKRTIEDFLIRNGIISILKPGYGSIYDSDKIIIAICDSCITKKLSTSTLLYNGDSEIEIEKAKKFYNRRKNLDKLL